MFGSEERDARGLQSGRHQQYHHSRGRRQRRGFDCGPANALLDEWAHRHLKAPSTKAVISRHEAQVNRTLLNTLLDEPFFEQQPPKSTGRDLFNPEWLDAKLVGFATLRPPMSRHACRADRHDGGARDRAACVRLRERSMFAAAAPVIRLLMQAMQQALERAAWRVSP